MMISDAAFAEFFWAMLKDTEILERKVCFVHIIVKFVPVVLHSASESFQIFRAPNLEIYAYFQLLFIQFCISNQENKIEEWFCF